jgi:hypothetical protein
LVSGLATHTVLSSGLIWIGPELVGPRLALGAFGSPPPLPSSLPPPPPPPPHAAITTVANAATQKGAARITRIERFITCSISSSQRRAQSVDAAALDIDVLRHVRIAP